MARFRPPYPSHSPTACVNGNPIAEGTEPTATVESTVDKVTVKGISGGSAEAVVKTVQGENEIEIYVSNEKGQNSPRTTAKVFTGQTRTVASRNVKGIISDDMLQLHTLLGRAHRRRHRRLYRP